MVGKNEYVKRANQEVTFTPDNVMELRRCAEDPIYFIRHYVKIQHPTRGSIPFELYPYQERMIRAFQENKYTVILSARQTGKSITSAAYLLWFAIFNFDKTILIASNKNSNAMEMIHRIRYAYENLPSWLKPGVEDDGWNKHNIGFDNGSRIISTATTDDSGRGMAISLLFLDEFAFVKSGIQTEFWTSIAPTLSTGGSCIMSSTPNGDMNLFAQIWRGAEVGANGFLPIRVFWNEPPGRDEAWKIAEIAKVGERRWLQEYECEFLSSDALLIDSLVLTNLTPIVEQIRPINVVKEIIFWKELRQGGTYLIGIDPSTGSGSDFSVIQVFEFPSLVQVAEYRSNTMSSALIYVLIKNLIKHIEKYDATIYFSVENNGVGEGIVALYESDEDPPMSAEFVSELGAKRKGMTTTKKTKMRACLNLKEMLEKGTIKINSIILLKELKTFTRKAGSYAAQLGSTDDCISAVLIVIRLLEEISSYEQDAHSKLYQIEKNDEDWWSDGSSADDDDVLPVII